MTLSEDDAIFVKEALIRVIKTGLYGPGGDPDDEHLFCAGFAFIVMDRLNLTIEGKEEIEAYLRQHNNYGDVLRDATVELMNSLGGSQPDEAAEITT